MFLPHLLFLFILFSQFLLDVRSWILHQKRPNLSNFWIVLDTFYSMEVQVAQSCPTLCDPMDYTVHGILQARILEWIAFPSPRFFPTQGSNPGLLHCRWFLYQLSHQGSPQIGDAEREMLCVASQEPDPLNNSMFTQGSLWGTVPWWQRG